MIGADRRLKDVPAVDPWFEKQCEMVTPGQHIAVIGTFKEALEARSRGLLARDAILIQTPEKTVVAYLFRVSIEGTITQNVLICGQGGLNIDGCRAQPTGEKLGGGNEKRCTLHKKQGWDRPWMADPVAVKNYTDRVKQTIEKSESLGRWPTNLLLVHGKDCVSYNHDGLTYWTCRGRCPVKQINEQANRASRLYPQFADFEAALDWLKRLIESKV